MTSHHEDQTKNSADNAQSRGMVAQLAHWRAQVVATNQRLGWKIGFNDRASQARMGLSATKTRVREELLLILESIVL